MDKVINIRKSKKLAENGTLVDSIEPMEIIVSEPTFPEAQKLTKEDVFGIFDVANMERVSNGMIVSRSDEVCKYFGDVVPYKSVTVLCRTNQVAEVSYWLEFVQGANCISQSKQLNDVQVAIRADYKCW